MAGAVAAACGATLNSAPVVIATTGRPLGLAAVLALARPAADLAAAVPSTAGLPPRPPLGLRATTTLRGALDLVAQGKAAAAVVPRGTATGRADWSATGNLVGNASGMPPVSPASLGAPVPLRLVVRRESVGGPRLPGGRLAPRERPFRFAYLPLPWGLRADTLVGAVVPELLRAYDGLPLGDGTRWDAFETEVEAVTALVDDRADAALLWPEGAAYALRDSAFALAATLPPTGAWADGAAPVLVGTVPPVLEAWVSALGAALDGPDALALLRLAFPERDPLALAGAVALRRADWSPPAT